MALEVSISSKQIPVVTLYVQCLFRFGGDNLLGNHSSLTGPRKVTDVQFFEHFLILGMGVAIPNPLHFEAETRTDLHSLAGKLIMFSIIDSIY